MSHDHDHHDDDDLEIPAPGLQRPRRLRRSGPMRDMAAETRLHPDMFCQPHFVIPGQNERQDIGAMPGIVRETPDKLVRTVEADLKLGIKHVLLFGLPSDKSPTGEGAMDPDGPVPAAIRPAEGAVRQRPAGLGRHLPLRLHRPRSLRRDRGRRGGQRRHAAAAGGHGLGLRPGRRRHRGARRHDGRPRRRHPRHSTRRAWTTWRS